MKRVAIGVAGLILMIATGWNLLAHGLAPLTRVAVAYHAWRSVPHREYHLQTPVHLPRKAVTLVMQEASQSQQSWLLTDKQGHATRLSIQMSGRPRTAGWASYTFSLPVWQAPPSNTPVKVIREFEQGSLSSYLLFYDEQNRLVGYARLYWRT